MADREPDASAAFEDQIGLAELALDAAIEIGRVQAGRDRSTYAFTALIERFANGRSSPAGERVSMLADTRKIALLRKATPISDRKAADRSETVSHIEQYLKDLLAGITAGNEEKIKESKALCLALNRELLKVDYEKLTSRRWRQENAA